MRSGRLVAGGDILVITGGGGFFEWERVIAVADFWPLNGM